MNQNLILLIKRIQILEGAQSQKKDSKTPKVRI